MKFKLIVLLLIFGFNIYANEENTELLKIQKWLEKNDKYHKYPIEYLKNIKSLYISTKWDNVDENIKLLNHLKNLEEIRFYYYELKNKYELNRFIRALRFLENLKKLDITAHNNSGITEINLIPFEELKNLEVLHLEHEGPKIIIEGLGSLNKLREFDLTLAGYDNSIFMYNRELELKNSVPSNALKKFFYFLLLYRLLRM